MKYFWLIIFAIFILLQFYYTKNYFYLIYGFIIISQALALDGESEGLSKAKDELKVLRDFQIKWNNFENHEANITINKNNPKRKDK